VQIFAPFWKDLDLLTSLSPNIMREASGKSVDFTTRGRAKVAMMENNFIVDLSFDWLRWTKDESCDNNG
jgi:preprotein translocase subunit SecB